MMTARAFNYDLHAELVSKWSEKRKFPLPPKDVLPDIGFFVGDAACGFLYTTNSQLGWAEWIFSNPEKSKEERSEALDLLFQLIQMTAKELGMKVLFSAAAFPAYGQILERNGFKETDTNMTHYIHLLGEK